MKKAFLLLSLMLASMAVKADDYGYLMFQDSQGARQFVVSAGTEITFTGGNLVASNTATGENVTIALAEMDYMRFTTTNVADNVTDDATPIHLVNIQKEADAASQWFDMSGRRLSQKPSRKGVYILKQSGSTQKIQIP